jgi:hypothetical protein
MSPDHVLRLLARKMLIFKGLMTHPATGGITVKPIWAPSEGRGHRFESCRVRHKINDLADILRLTIFTSEFAMAFNIVRTMAAEESTRPQMDDAHIRPGSLCLSQPGQYSAYKKSSRRGVKLSISTPFALHMQPCQALEGMMMLSPGPS